MIKTVKYTLITVFSIAFTIFGGLSLSGFTARAELVTPTKDGAQTLVTIYDDGALGEGTELVRGSAFTDLNYNKDTQNPSKHIGLDCTQIANTEFYIDLARNTIFTRAQAFPILLSKIFIRKPRLNSG